MKWFLLLLLIPLLPVVFYLIKTTLAVIILTIGWMFGMPISIKWKNKRWRLKWYRLQRLDDIYPGGNV